jgi:signal transduction histidine kinase
MLGSLIESLVSEKRLQFKANPLVHIETHLDSSNFDIFSEVNASQIKRILSNLVNNSVDAKNSNNGLKIEIILEKKSAKEATITIKDNGTGMPSTLVNDFNMGKFKSYGKEESKESGSGVGVASSNDYIKSLGGKMRFDSTYGIGTTITIFLKLCSAPNWFSDSLKFSGNSKVFIVDDDQSIHQIWEGRFESLGESAKSVERIHFSEISVFKKHLEESCLTKIIL